MVCLECHGKNVVLVVDEAACRSDEEKAHLKLYHEQLQEEADYQRTCEAERRMGC